MNDRIPVLVYTDKRGVFFGWAKPADLERDDWRKQIALTECRMCVRWSKDVRGVLGLAATGPTASCRITPAVAEQTLVDLHGVTACSAEAVAAWEKEPWNS